MPTRMSRSPFLGGFLLVFSLHFVSGFSPVALAKSPIAEQLIRRFHFELAGSPRDLEPFLIKIAQEPIALYHVVTEKRSLLMADIEKSRLLARQYHDGEALEAIASIKEMLALGRNPAEMLVILYHTTARYGDPDPAETLLSTSSLLADAKRGRWQMAMTENEKLGRVVDVWIESGPLADDVSARLEDIAPPFAEALALSQEERLQVVFDAEVKLSELMSPRVSEGATEEAAKIEAILFPGLTQKDVAEGTGAVLSIVHKLIQEEHDVAVAIYVRHLRRELKKKAGNLKMDPSETRAYLEKHYQERDLYYRVRALVSSLPERQRDALVRFVMFCAKNAVTAVKGGENDPLGPFTLRIAKLLYEEIAETNQEGLHAQLVKCSRLYALMERWISLSDFSEKQFYAEFLTDYSLPQHTRWRRVAKGAAVAAGLGVPLYFIGDNYHIYFEILFDED